MFFPAKRPPPPTGKRLRVESPFEPNGDQPRAIAALIEGLRAEERDQVLLGVEALAIELPVDADDGPNSGFHRAGIAARGGGAGVEVGEAESGSVERHAGGSQYDCCVAT
jgi:hypothetical protein